MSLLDSPQIIRTAWLLAGCLALPPAAVAVQQSPPPDRTLDLSFDDLAFDMEKDEEWSPQMLTDEINALQGKRVSLRGYILPSTKQSGITAFVFVRDNQECCFGPGAALFDCVLVKLRKDHAVDYTVRPVTVEGEFMIKEYRVGNRIMAIFRMKDGTVSQ